MVYGAGSTEYGVLNRGRSARLYGVRGTEYSTE